MRYCQWIPCRIYPFSSTSLSRSAMRWSAGCSPAGSACRRSWATCWRAWPSARSPGVSGRRHGDPSARGVRRHPADVRRRAPLLVQAISGRSGDIAIPGAILQMTIATIIGYGSRPAVRRVAGGVAGLGIAISVASTVVLHARADGHRPGSTLHGRVAVGWLVLEDLVMVAILVLLPLLSVSSSGDVLVVGRDGGRQGAAVRRADAGRRARVVPRSSARVVQHAVAGAVRAGRADGRRRHRARLVRRSSASRSRSAPSSPASSSASRRSVTGRRRPAAVPRGLRGAVLRLGRACWSIRLPGQRTGSRCSPSAPSSWSAKA